jgi:hypothetical protein
MVDVMRRWLIPAPFAWPGMFDRMKDFYAYNARCADSNVL